MVVPAAGGGGGKRLGGSERRLDERPGKRGRGGGARRAFSEGRADSGARERRPPSAVGFCAEPKGRPGRLRPGNPGLVDLSRTLARIPQHQAVVAIAFWSDSSLGQRRDDGEMKGARRRATRGGRAAGYLLRRVRARARMRPSGRSLFFDECRSCRRSVQEIRQLEMATMLTIKQCPCVERTATQDNLKNEALTCLATI